MRLIDAAALATTLVYLEHTLGEPREEPGTAHDEIGQQLAVVRSWAADNGA